MSNEMAIRQKRRIEVVAFSKAPPGRHYIAKVDIQVGPFIIHQCPVLPDKNGGPPYVAMPAQSYKNAEGKTVYNRIITVSEAFAEDINREVRGVLGL